MDTHVLRVHQFLPVSYANGPGARAVIWTQGCSLGCPGCFNPETHPFEDGEGLVVGDLFARMAALIGKIEGLSVSGGEPLQQFHPLLALLKRIRAETGLSILLFTGYTPDEIRLMPEADDLLACLDVLIASRYDRARRLGYGLRGSSNQTIHLLTTQYSREDVEAVPPAEVVIADDGTVTLSGIDPPEW